MLSAGLVGLPNVGKSTLFNLLTAGAAEIGDYPFTTIEQNVGVVAVPDERLHALAELLAPEEVTPAVFRLIDIAGLVEGASRGEGLGNRFLAHIREVDAIVHVLRGFRTEEVAHVFGGVDAARDAAVVETELVLADLELVERVIGRREKVWRTSPEEAAGERRLLEGARQSLAAGTPLRRQELAPADRDELARLGLLTVRPQLVLLNVDESEAEPERRAAELAGALTVEAEAVLALPVSLEVELARLEEGEAAEFRAELGLTGDAVDRVSVAVFGLLDLIRFYTVVHGKLTAWAIPRGTTAVAAAGRIHSQMEEGFIRAEVCTAADLLRLGSMAALVEQGRMRTEGRDYEVRDGDVVEFRFRPSSGS